MSIQTLVLLKDPYYNEGEFVRLFSEVGWPYPGGCVGCFISPDNKIDVTQTNFKEQQHAITHQENGLPLCARERRVSVIL